PRRLARAGTRGDAGGRGAAGRFGRYPLRRQTPSSEYTRRAVPAKSAAFSSGEAPDAIRLKAFHSTTQPVPILSTGKLLSNRHRSAPNSSIAVPIQGRHRSASCWESGGVVSPP